MSEAYLLFVVALLMATVLITIICASIRCSKWAKYRNLAKLCRGLGFAVAGGLLVAASEIIFTAAASSAPGLAESARTQIWRNGLTEALHNIAVASFVSIPALLVARRSLRAR